MNQDNKVIEEFGEEWSKFSYSKSDQDKLFNNFQQYFKIFPWDLISNQSEGFDMGCGSGRWAQFVAPKVGLLNCIEPSKAISVAKENLKKFENVNFLMETTSGCSLAPNSQDFGYCLGVLHHIPDTQKALSDCAKLLKKGAPFLLYLYYDFENKPIWFKVLWKIADVIRKFISQLPNLPKKWICEFIALFVYLPLSQISKLFEKLGLNVENFPLSDYRTKTYYQMRNDALDRFGTRLEQRFSKEQIIAMLSQSGFERISFSNESPFWCSIAYKR